MDEGVQSNVEQGRTTSEDRCEGYLRGRFLRTQVRGEKEESIWNCPKFLAWTVRGGGVCCGGERKKELEKGREHRLCADTGQKRVDDMGSPKPPAGVQE